ncbi:MAG: M20/M25/M40 family metallo-hydrolase [Chloroflexi bacterium]|nr:M20/M25/M40 family metallo-hydrolase [Chloroflexota bacterium]
MPLPPNLLDSAVSLLRDLLRVETTNPGRPEAPAARLLAAYLESHGIAAELVEPAPGRTSLIAHLPGAGDPPALLLLSHIDTVPVPDTSSWAHGPFTAEMADGYLWGRGALDAKGQAAAHAATLVLLREKPLRRGVVLVAAADEERGGEMGVRWLRQHKPDTLRASYALGEGGGFKGSLGNRPYYTCAVAEKGSLDVRIHARGPSGHASVPPATMAPSLLVEAVRRITRLPWPWTPGEASTAFLRGLGRGQPLPRSLALRALASRPLGPFLLQRGFGLSGEQARALRTLFYTTATLTAIHADAGEAANVVPTEAEATINVRYLPGDSPDTVLTRIRQALRSLGNGVTAEAGTHSPARSAPLDTPLFQAIQETMGLSDPGVPTLPFLLPASTDLRELDVPGYGFFPLPHLPPEEAARLVHGHDERIRLDDLAFAIEATVEVARRVCDG